MERVFNNGTYFFEITSPQMNGADKRVDKLIDKDVISFSITEELGKFVSGSLVLVDDTGAYSQIFRSGMQFTIAWGYRTVNFSNLDLGFSSLKNTIRNGLTCYIQTESGSASEAGEHIYTVTFYGGEFLKNKTYKIFSSGSRGDMVSSLMDDLDVAKRNQYINFERSKEMLSASTFETQGSSPFPLLHSLAKRYNCMFQVGYDGVGARHSLFIDDTKIDCQEAKSYINSVAPTDQFTKNLYFNSGKRSNVSSYSWQHHVGESGQGDDVQMVLINGKAVYQRRVTSGGMVSTWNLNEARLRTAMLNASDKGVKIWKQIQNSSDFDGVKMWFDEAPTGTAPQGLGFTINCKMVGDPALTIPMQVVFKNGFPAPLTQSQDDRSVVKYFVRKITHSFSKSGYFCDLEICDLYSINGSFIADIFNTTQEGAVTVGGP